jgi:C_GCAxxG_C_C family probable redox protein
MKKSEKAIEFFSNNFNCAQSVLAVFAQDFGLSEDQCLKISCAFGGGIGRQQLTCGAVTGALMALGLKYGRGLKDDNQKKAETYQKTVEFMKEFKKKHGSINCKELLQGLDMGIEEDMKKINELKLHDTICVECVKDAVEIAEKMIS